MPGAAYAANNPGTGDTGFFTFRPSTPSAGSQVNVASGNMLVRARDLSDGLLTYGVVVDRTYNSLAPDSYSILSPRWTFDVGPSTKLVEQPGGNVIIDGPSGYHITFTKLADSSYQPPVGFDGGLTKIPGGWTLSRTSQGDQFGFDSQGNLTTTKDAQARDFTVQNTSAAGRTILSSYGTNSGRRVNISYTGDSLVRQMDDPASGHHYYTHTSGRLTGYQDPAGPLTTYRYDPAGWLDKITEPDGTTVEFATSPNGKVASTTSTAPGGPAQTTSFNYARRTFKSDVTAPAGVRRTYAYDDDWRVTRQYNPDVVPTVTPSGEVKNLQGGYVGPHRTYPLTVAADQPDGAGLRRLAVERGDGVEIAGADVPCATTPFDLVCPTTYSSSFDLNFANDPEGERTLRGSARDDEQHYETSSAWSVLLDKTGPQTITEFGAADVDGNGNSALSWTAPVDPALADGHPGSGVKEYSVRYRINGGAWSTPVTTTQPVGTANGLAGGDAVIMEVGAIDHVGNTTTSESEAIVVGPEPPDPCDAVPTPSFCADPAPDESIDAEEDPDDVELAPIPDDVNDDGLGARGLPAQRFRFQSSNELCDPARATPHKCWTTLRNMEKSFAVGAVRVHWHQQSLNGLASQSLFKRAKIGERAYEYGETTWTETAAQKNCGWIYNKLTSGGQGSTTADCPSGNADQRVDYRKFQSKPYGGRIGGDLVRGNNCYRANGEWLLFGLVCNDASPIKMVRSSIVCANVFTTLSEGRTRSDCREKDTLGTFSAGHCVRWRYVTYDRKWVMVRDPNKTLILGGWVFIRTNSLPADRSTWPGRYQQGGCD